MEVFAISGASPPALCPPGWERTPNGNCGAPAGNCPPNMRSGKACRAQTAIDLQNALRALGQAVNDAALIVNVDGFIGPQTQAAVNKAFTKHIASGRTPAPFRTGSMAMADVAQNASNLAALVKAEVARRGQTVPAAPPAAALPAEAPAAAPTPSTAISTTPVWALMGLNAVLVASGLYMAHKTHG